MTKPSFLSFALLAQHTYQSIDREPPHGWRVIASKSLKVGEISPDNSKFAQKKVAGLFGRVSDNEVPATQTLTSRMIAYYHPESNQVVIAFRGTDFSDPDDVAQDIDIALSVEPGRVKIACEFVSEVQLKISSWGFWKNQSLLSRAQWPNPRCYLTGHSLGAAIAERVALKTGLETVTFDSPGNADPDNQLDYRYKNKITSILSFPNLVNCANRHVGKVYHIESQLPGAERRTQVKKIAGKTLKFGANVALAYFGIVIPNDVYDFAGAALDKASLLQHTFFTHSMTGFVEYFQGANVLREVTSWPSLSDFLASSDPKSLAPTGLRFDSDTPETQYRMSSRQLDTLKSCLVSGLPMLLVLLYYLYSSTQSTADTVAMKPSL